ncbi:hypothetical protein [Novacetimonas pomaceti]|uniref:hypothetical protein n=1 Tax=Novacetimonas pomaceti TaxID=2021998 RepID=UPI001C2CD80D|nr:hypothetical protein [Novacetimonas pomaceti]MBV1833580.1 hypothetical protein [Novacetimonas pomaceti]
MKLVSKSFRKKAAFLEKGGAQKLLILNYELFSGGLWKNATDACPDDMWGIVVAAALRQRTIMHAPRHAKTQNQSFATPDPTAIMFFEKWRTRKDSNL